MSFKPPKQRISTPLGNTLSEYLQMHQMQQQTLSDYLSIDIRTLKRWISGDIILRDLQELKRVANLLGVDPESLVIATLNLPPTAEQIDTAVDHAWSLINEARIQEARALLERLVLGTVPSDSSPLLRSLLRAYHATAFATSLNARTDEVSQAIYYYGKMEELARVVDDDTSLNIALSYQEEMRRRRGDITSELSSPITIEEFLLQCAVSIKACWYLLRGKGLVLAEEMLSACVPSLAKLTFSPSSHQETAAGLATQAKILQAILAMHKLNFVAREMYCHEAVQCSRLSADSGLQAAALMYLAYTYIRCPPSRPEKAVSTFLAALRALGKEISLLRSDIYMGLADAYARCKEERKAVESIDFAHMHFPQHPEQDPRFLYADCRWFELHSDTGKMYLDLALHYPDRGYDQKAYEIFTQLSGLQSATERNTNETVIRQADAARGLGDLGLYVNCLEKGALMAFSLGSQKYYSEAYDVFQRTPERWRHEQKIQTLANDVFGQLPGRRRDE